MPDDVDVMPGVAQPSGQFETGVDHAGEPGGDDDQTRHVCQPNS